MLQSLAVILPGRVFAQTLGTGRLYTPRSISVWTADNWRPTLEQDQVSCFRFYARWTGSLWQNDGHYLKEDGFDHDSLSALYREFAQKLSLEVSRQSRRIIRRTVDAKPGR